MRRATLGYLTLLPDEKGSEYSLFTSDGASQNSPESGVYSYLNNFHVLAGKMGAEFATENKINTLLFKPRSNRRNDQASLAFRGNKRDNLSVVGFPHAVYFELLIYCS